MTGVYFTAIVAVITSLLFYNAQNKPGPHCKSDTPDDIAIVGAGIAGAYTAWRLRDAGLKVSLYEYSNRVGGRFYTVKFPGIPDINIEMGAMRFKPLEHPLLTKAINQLGLTVTDFDPGFGMSPDKLFYLRGKHLKATDLSSEAPYNFGGEYEKDVDQLKRKLLKNLVEQAAEGITSPYHLKSIDGELLYKQSLSSFAKKHLPMEIERFLRDSNLYDSRHRCEVASDWLFDNASYWIDTSHPVKTVTSGFQSIPEAMVEAFLKASKEHRFHINSHLVSIKRHQDVYSLFFQPTCTVRGKTSEIQEIPTEVRCAKKVFLAIPKLSLERLDWAALKRKETADILKNAVSGEPAMKLYFAYDNDNRTKPQCGLSYIVSSTPLKQTFDYAISNSTGKIVINVAYTDRELKSWRSMDRGGAFDIGIEDKTLGVPNMMVNFAAKMYAEVCNMAGSDVRMPKNAIMKSWDSYPMEAAWYLWQPGYIRDHVVETMTKPSAEENVFIVSNVFSKTMRQMWAEGALEIVDSTLRKYFTDITLL